MTRLMANEAVALFGSQVRGDADLHSDSDILLLSDRVVNRERNHLASLGYSVSAFTWGQFERMAQEGSLFVQHLKQESILLHDPLDRLKRSLDNFTPCCDQITRIVDNLALFMITRGVPAHSATVGWASDVMAVAIRNHAVLSSAQEGVFLFSYPALMERLSEQHGLSSYERQLLYSLRVSKREYRAFGRTGSADWAQLYETQLLIEKMLSVPCVEKPQSVSTFVQERLAERPRQEYWYRALRSYEGALRAVGPTSVSEDRALVVKLDAIMRNPSSYGISEFGSIGAVQNAVRYLASRAGALSVQ